jgi:hypothetical protein
MIRRHKEYSMIRALVFLSTIVWLACGDSGSDSEPITPPPLTDAKVLPTSSPNLLSLRRPDGTYDFYVGPEVKSAVDEGKPIPPGWYRLGNVTQQRVDQAMMKSTKVATYSLEDPASGDMEIEFSGNPSTKFRAGDPCLSGVVQVAIEPKSGQPTALFDVYQWVRYPNGPTVKNTWTTHVLPDEPWPALKYNGGSPNPDCR